MGAIETRKTAGLMKQQTMSDTSNDPDSNDSTKYDHISNTLHHRDHHPIHHNASHGSVPHHETHTSRPPLYTYMLAGIACLNSSNLGYSQGCSGGASELMGDDMNWEVWQQEVFVGCLGILSIFGALSAGVISDKFGRRFTFTVAGILFIIGTILSVSVPIFSVIMSGRVLVGLGIGLGLAIDPMYISEISPASHRGTLVAFSEIADNLGILLGYVADYALYRLPMGLNWRLMLGLGIIMPSVLVTLSITVMPESPRWLLKYGRDEEASEVLRRTHVAGTDIESVVREMKSKIGAEKESEVGWMSLLCPSPAIRLMLMAGIGIAICQQLNGQEAFLYFAPQILQDAGFTSKESSFGMTVLLGIIKLFFIGVALLRVDEFGRRPLLFFSIGGMTVFLVLIAFSSPHVNLAPLSVFAMAGFFAFFSVGIGPVTWLGAAEVFPFHIRAKAMSLATSSNRLIAGVISLTALSLIEMIGTFGLFLLFAILTVVSGVYLYLYFPETKGLSLEQVTEQFEKAARGNERRRDGQELESMESDSELDLEQRDQSTSSENE